jgi:ATP/maltotriose-dependent transcriptional regulator MalT
VTNDPAQPATPTRVSKVVRSPRAEALLGSAPEEQIAAALSAEQWARAADLIARHGERLLLDEGTRVLTGHLAALPESEVAKNPRVAAIAAWVNLYQQRYHDARQRLSQAERALKQLELAEVSSEAEHFELTPHAELKQSLTALRLHLQAVSEGRLPQDVSEIMIPASTDHPLWRAGALIILGRCHLHAGELALARDGLEAAQMLAQTSRGKRAQRTAAEATVLLGAIAEGSNALTEASWHYDQVVPRTEEILTAQVAAAEVGRAAVALQRLDLKTANSSVARARVLAEGLTDGLDPFRMTVDLGLVEGWCQALSGELDGARQTFDHIERSLNSMQIRWPLELLGIERARLAMLRGDESSAKRWLQQHQMQGRQGNAPPTVPVEALGLLMSAQVMVSLHKPDEAAQYANEVLDFAERRQLRRLAIDALIQLGLARFAAGQRDAAISALKAALEGADAERLAYPFVLRGLADVAVELGLSHPLLDLAASHVPTGSAAARPRPVVRAAASGPIETAQVATASDAEPVHEADAEPAPAEQAASAEAGETNTTSPEPA